LSALPGFHGQTSQLAMIEFLGKTDRAYTALFN
jgi:hypothetical protein